jgi:hypothetical protein
LVVPGARERTHGPAIAGPSSIYLRERAKEILYIYRNFLNVENERRKEKKGSLRITAIVFSCHC